MRNKISIFTGNSNPKLAKAICNYLEVPLGQAIVDRFPGGEIHVQIKDNIRGKDVLNLDLDFPFRETSHQSLS